MIFNHPRILTELRGDHWEHIYRQLVTTSMLAQVVGVVVVVVTTRTPHPTNFIFKKNYSGGDNEGKSLVPPTLFYHGCTWVVLPPPHSPRAPTHPSHPPTTTTPTNTKIHVILSTFVHVSIVKYSNCSRIEVCGELAPTPFAPIRSKPCE
jgi:hypothetical protein